MATIKINAEVEDQVWKDLKILAKKSHQNTSELFTKAISDHVHRQRMKSVVLDHLSESMNNNNEFGKLLTK